MKYTVIISREAEKDLREIYEYIAFELQSPDNASGQLERLEKAILSLNEMPYRFREYNRKKWKKHRQYVMPVGNYCVFYVPDDDMERVTITRVIYGARDLPKVLDSEKK